MVTAQPSDPLVGRNGGPASSARAWLLTVLGEFVLPDGGAAWTSAILRALSVLGVEAKAARQALARTGAADLLTPTRVGRNTRWDLTPSAARLLADGAERIYRFGRDHPAWDGQWLLVLASVPENDRHLRHALRARLGWLGFASAGPGVWLSPWISRQEEATAVLSGLSLDGSARVFRAEAAGMGDPATTVGDIWDLAELEGRYRSFTVDAAQRHAADDRSAFAHLVGLVHEWRTFPVSDPDLPARLLPHDWPATEAAAVFADRRREWSPAAWRWWQAGAGAPGA